MSDTGDSIQAAAVLDALDNASALPAGGDDMLLDIELEARIQFGAREMQLSELLELTYSWVTALLRAARLSWWVETLACRLQRSSHLSLDWRVFVVFTDTPFRPYAPETVT
jgi:hypothetical protein